MLRVCHLSLYIGWRSLLSYGIPCFVSKERLDTSGRQSNLLYYLIRQVRLPCVFLSIQVSWAYLFPFAPGCECRPGLMQCLRGSSGMLEFQFVSVAFLLFRLESGWSPWEAGCIRSSSGSRNTIHRCQKKIKHETKFLLKLVVSCLFTIKKDAGGKA